MSLAKVYTCDRCRKAYLHHLGAEPPKYVICEVQQWNVGDIREELDLCPECSEDLKRFMEYKEVHILAGVETNGSVE